jgi:hypothetical protein
MKTSTNHHFISRKVLEKFFNSKGRIYIYSKNLNNPKLQNPYSNTGTKNIFSDSDLNTTLHEGETSSILENQLNQHFEQDYPKHYEIIINSIDKNTIKGIKESIYYLARLALIGQIRNKHYKKQVDESIFNVLDEIHVHAIDKLKNEYAAYKETISSLKYKSHIDFTEYADQVFEKMGNWNFYVFNAIEKSPFILPDTSSFVSRERINEYFNDTIKDISEIGFPINNKLFALIFSCKKGKQRIDTIINASDIRVNKLNKYSYQRASEQVACCDEMYLTNHVRTFA